jgi:DNA-binding LytR/AlgR family response regulator
VGEADPGEAAADRQPGFESLPGPRGRLRFECGRRTLFVSAAEVIRIEAEGNYSRVSTPSAGFLVREGVASLARRLAPHGFRRVHRSAIVNLDRVTEIRRTSRYTWTVVLRDGSEVPLAPGCRDDLERALSGA